MSTFITDNDYLERIDSNVLLQIVGEVGTLLDRAEEDSIATIKDLLSGLYNMGAEFSKTGTSRHRNLVRWTMDIAIYYAYRKIPGDQVPERVIKDYDNTMADLIKIAAGKVPTTLAPVTIEDNIPKTVFRWGSNTKRSH